MPLLLHLRIPTDTGSFGVWLPWFLVYPVLLALMLLVLPVMLIAVVFTLPFGYARPLVLVWPYLWRLLFSMRGLNVEIATGPREIQLRFI
jgi:hypothetical protein